MKFQTFWSGRRISPYEVLCLRSFTGAGHEIDLHTYDPDMPRLPGVTVCNAAELLPQSEYRENVDCFAGHPGVFADHFRYKLLYERGGWWIDTDVMLVGFIREQMPCVGYQDAELVNNAIMHFARRHPVMHDCLNATERLRRIGDVVWGTTGPNLLTEVLTKHGMLHLAAEASDYYPFNFADIGDVFRPKRIDDVRKRLSGATFLHLWNAKISERTDKFAEPKPGSWLREEADRLLGRGEWRIWQAWGRRR